MNHFTSRQATHILRTKLFAGMVVLTGIILSSFATAQIPNLTLPQSAQEASVNPRASIRISGEITAYHFTTPSTSFELRTENSDGSIASWRVETDSAAALLRQGWTADTLRVGELVIVEGTPQLNDLRTLTLAKVTRLNGEQLLPSQTHILASLPSGSYAPVPSTQEIMVSFDQYQFSTQRFRFYQFDTQVQLNSDALEESSVAITLLSNSLNAPQAQLHQELVGERGFDFIQYPVIAFQSTDITLGGNHQLNIEGDLSIRGQTHSVTLWASIKNAGAHPITGQPSFGIEGVAYLSRSAWGIQNRLPSNTPMQSASLVTDSQSAPIGDQVVVNFSGEYQLAHTTATPLFGGDSYRSSQLDDQ